jgi:thiosulfate/3-mercaptopyruvate sulfurtransferase
LASSGEVLGRIHDPDWLLVDSRARERYAGELEPIDPVAGRIPGALNLPHSATVGPDGRFLPPEDLKAQFERLLSGRQAARAVFYCGSGVTAARNLLALAYAELGEGRLYAGSWSEWILDPARPVASGSGPS